MTTQLLGASSSSSSSSPSASTHSGTYDVFLSFRGVDTRHTFTDHLNKSLVRNGIKTFIDDELGRGEEISAALTKAIEESKIFVIVFSENYASSKWCLEELVKILQYKAWKKKMVYPIFYKVDPSDIRKQTGSFGEALAKHGCEFKEEKDECKFKEKMEMLQRWRNALSEAGNLSGRHLSEDGYESAFVYEVVEEISTQVLKCNPLNVASYPVGIESRVQDMLKLLDVGKNNVHMVGIWGLGGIGKTTIAKAVYNSISHKFDSSCFLANVREESLTHAGLVKLQNILLSKIVGGNGLTVMNADEGINVLKERLGHKRVLLILDDVNHLDQLNKLAGGYDWFGSGSRVIITTREKHCLTALGVHSIYEVKELNDEESLQLFIFHAFKGINKRMDDFVELTADAILYAKGIPLVLKVLGSDLCGRSSVDEWQDALENYKRYPNQEIQETFKRSYNALEDSMKEVFLHIACFFKGKEMSYVIDILQRCDLNPKYCIKVLAEKALISIVEDNNIWMHDLIEDMGKEIVRQESPNEAGKRSRLWLYEDVCHVLEENTGTEKIKGIMVTNPIPQQIRMNSGSFTKLKNLQILIVDPDIILGDGVDYLSNQLRALCWKGCPLQSLPSTFNPKKLVMLEMNRARTCPLNEGLKNMRYLKYIHLTRCAGLTRIPDLSGLTSLVELDLFHCSDLVEVHDSVGVHDKLAHLDLGFCKKLRMFQRRIHMKSLETLHLANCPLEFFPEIEGEMKCLKSLDLSLTAIKELPSTIGYLTGLELLYLFYCENLTTLPWSIFYEFQHLRHLRLADCHKLVTSSTKSESRPRPPVFSTNFRISLSVNLMDCRGLQQVPEFRQESVCLNVRGCVSLERISNLSKILQGQDSRMMLWMDLSNCHILCDNLAREYEAQMTTNKKSSSAEPAATQPVVTKETKKLTILLSRFLSLAEPAATHRVVMKESKKLKLLLSFFLSCPKSEFQVVFPASAQVPKWFTWSKNFKRNCGPNVYQFHIEFPQNFKWQNKGLAFCAQTSDHVESLMFSPCIKVYINGIRIQLDKKGVQDHDLYNNEHDQRMMYTNHVWLYYIPFLTIISRSSSESELRPLHPWVVWFELNNLGSCGIHVVLPHEEEDFSTKVVFYELNKYSSSSSNRRRRLGRL